MKPMLRFSLALFALCSTAAQAAESPPAVASGTAHRALYSVAFDGETGLAVGAFGTILQTVDGGGHWQALPAVTAQSLLGVEIRGPVRLAVGQTGLILRQQADGVWQTVASGTRERLLAVDANLGGRALIAGAFGTVLKSEDAGASWSRLAIDWNAWMEPGTEPHVYAVDVDEQGVITLAGEYGLILRSEDGGASWARVHSGDASLFALYLGEDGSGYAVGQSGKTLRSADHGRSWSEVDAGTTANLLGVWATPDGRVAATGMREIRYSADRGSTWKGVAEADAAHGWYSGVAAGGNGGIYAVGYSERVISLQP